jgi:hypothetical protein
MFSSETLETLRLYPPVAGNIRQVAQSTVYGMFHLIRAYLKVSDPFDHASVLYTRRETLLHTRWDKVFSLSSLLTTRLIPFS